MRLSEIQFNDSAPVDGYGPGFFRIGGQVYDGPVLTGPNGTGTWQGYGDVEPLLALAGEVDVLFIGTGREIAHLPEDLRSALDAAGLGIEIAASPAAARTYNVLLSEGRRIGAALLPV